MPETSLQSPVAADRQSITQAYQRIQPHIRRTPVVEVNPADFGLKVAKLVFKLEYLQHTGSFKARGAMNNMLARAVPKAGVAAASGGNHGAAVAYAAMKRGVPAKIFVPSVSSAAKQERIRGYGAELTVGGELYADAFEACEKYVAETGALNIHAYDQAETLQGAATVGLELEEQWPEMETMFISVGGGGLIGGVAAWYEGRAGIIGIEPELSPTLTRALEAGRPVDSPGGGVAADSLAPRRVGQLMFPIAQQLVKQVILVPDSAIQQAQQKLWDVMRIVTEPGGAAAFAALLAGQYQPRPDEKICVLLCGANTTAVSF
jgi:threonine dehydratase